MVETLHVVTREEWREWLRKHHAVKGEIWLVYYKKHTGKPRIPYDDAVEEAICFGWIDSTVKRVDDERYMQKYTPRRERSVWSAHNKRRATKMIDRGLMTEAGLAAVEEAKRNGEWEKKDERPAEYAIPPDLEEALEANTKARDYFLAFPPSYRRLSIGWITSAKRDETRKKRIRRQDASISER